MTSRSKLSLATTHLLADAKANEATYFTNSKNWASLNMHLTAYKGQNPKLTKALQQLHTHAGLPNTPATHKHLQFLLLNLAASMKNGRPVALACPSSKNTVVGWSEKENPQKLTSTLLLVVNALAKEGYLVKLSPKPHVGGSDRLILGRILPTPKLVDEVIEPFDLLKIRSHILTAKGFVVVTKVETLEEREKVRRKVDIMIFKASNELRVIKTSNSFLSAYNRLLTKSQITLAQGTQPAGHGKLVQRMFCRGSLEHGGRFYGGFWQALPSGKMGQIPSRKDILINNAPTVELDFKALHPTMLYAWQGAQPPQGDAYDLPNWPRELVKKAMLVAFNCRTKGEKAVLNAVRKDEDLASHYPLLLQGGYDRLKADFIAKHPLLEQYLHEDAGIKLQRQDSEIAMAVMKAMMGLKTGAVATLCVHDSFICAARYEAELREAMVTAYREVMGTTVAPDIKRSA